jgi:hypothetical protein
VNISGGESNLIAGLHGEIRCLAIFSEKLTLFFV